jgi:hypothetical protein
MLLPLEYKQEFIYITNEKIDFHTQYKKYRINNMWLDEIGEYYFHDRINEFIEERGKLFTGTIVFKEYIDLKKYPDNKTNEWRVFYLKLYPILIVQNSYLDTKEQPPIELIERMGKIINNNSNFYTVDFALKENGEWTVIETGDGQVSGLPEGNGNELSFYNNLCNNLNLLQ